MALMDEHMYKSKFKAEPLRKFLKDKGGRLEGVYYNQKEFMIERALIRDSDEAEVDDWLRKNLPKKKTKAVRYRRQNTAAAEEEESEHEDGDQDEGVDAKGNDEGISEHEHKDDSIHFSEELTEGDPTEEHMAELMEEYYREYPEQRGESLLSTDVRARVQLGRIFPIDPPDGPLDPKFLDAIKRNKKRQR
jgi:hypothetical protein